MKHANNRIYYHSFCRRILLVLSEYRGKKIKQQAMLTAKNIPTNIISQVETEEQSSVRRKWPTGADETGHREVSLVNLIESEQKENINRAIKSLCDWIVERMINGTSDNELANLPEVVRATAELIRAVDN